MVLLVVVGGVIGYTVGDTIGVTMVTGGGVGDLVAPTDGKCFQ
jgi:hypothetical protein